MVMQKQSGATGIHIPTYSHILTTQKWKARSYTDRLSEHKKRAHPWCFYHGFYRFFSKSPGFPSAFHGFPHLMELHRSSVPLDETAHHRCDVPAATAYGHGPIVADPDVMSIHSIVILF